MKVIFDVLHLYYLPQYLPVLKALLAKNIDVSFVFYQQVDPALNEVCHQVIRDEQLDVFWVEDWQQACEYYLAQKADWIIFGNKVADIDKIHQISKTVLMQHGIGPKRCYYQVSENLTTVRFIEGQHRLERLLSLYPDGNFVDTGYAKLDPAINNDIDQTAIERFQLDPNKPTLLYAPTFYPSSIECFSKSFPEQFAQYNILIKPHFFTLTKEKYHKQRKLLERWQQYSNVYVASVAEYNLMPFMAAADVMLSDASSAIFEFAALDKPVVWCDFYKLRWSYRGIFSFRFKQRIDSDINYFNQVAVKAESYQALPEAVNKAMALSQEQITTREQVVEQLAGKIDGQCSVRIVNYLLDNK